MTHNQLVIERLEENNVANYHLTNYKDQFIGKVNWLNVNGARVAFDEGTMEVGGPVDVEIVGDGAGAKIRTE